MDVIAQQIRQFSPVLYIACAIGFITFAFVGITSLRDYRKAVFRMERSSVGARVTGAWVRAVMCAMVGLGIYFITAASSPVSVSSRRNIVATIVLTPTKPGLILPTSLPTADYSNPSPVITPTFVIGNEDATPSVALVSDVVTGETTLTDPSAALTPSPFPTPGPAIQSPVRTVAPESTTAAQSTAIQTAVAQNAPAVAAAGMAQPSPTVTPRTPTRAPNETASGATATSAPILATNTSAPVPTIVPIQPQSAATTIPTAAPAAAPAADSGLLAPDCVDPGTVGILSPGQGDTIAGKRAVTGNAGFPNDGSYAKLEIMPQEGGGWRFLSKIDVGVREGQLGAVDPSYFAPGPYFLRLLIVDKDGHEIRICRVSVRIAG